MKDIEVLRSQFTKGVAYFKVQYATGNPNPIVRRQLAAFWRDVVEPLDKACAGLSESEMERFDELVMEDFKSIFASPSVKIFK